MLNLENLQAKLLRAEGDITKVTGDLLVFLGYFLVSFYAGGYAYLRSYRSSFRLWADNEFNSTTLLFVFIDKVLASNFYWAVFLIAATFFAVYVLSKFVLATWLGLCLTSLSILASFVFFVWVGETAGNADAKADKLTDSRLPQIFIKYEGSPPIDLDQPGIRLFGQDENFLYIFEDQGGQVGGEIGQVRVYALRKEEVLGYEIL